MPTIPETAGVPAPPRAEGKSLWPMILGQASDNSRVGIVLADSNSAKAAELKQQAKDWMNSHGVRH